MQPGSKEFEELKQRHFQNVLNDNSTRDSETGEGPSIFDKIT